MIIKKVEIDQAVNTIQDFIQNENHGWAYCIHDKKVIFLPQNENYNESFCKENNYEILNTLHSGGIVVVNKNDISFVHFGPIGDETMLNFANYLVNYYISKGLNAVFDGNDILIDGYKISGLSATPYNHIQYSTIHVGINTNLEDIKAICTKPMVKIPKGLNEYNITAEEIEQIFFEFCKENKYQGVK